MSRKYAVSLVEDIKRNEYLEVIQDVPVIVKPIPDLNVVGAMDPRLKKSMGVMAKLIPLIPKKRLNMNLTNEGVVKLRNSFENISSTSFVSDVVETTFDITVDDGYQMEAVKFESNHTVSNAPILYFIHGGGFFGGSINVVSEALRYIVSKSGFIAVSVNYRLAPEHLYPRSHKDVYDGLKWVIDNADKLGGSRDKIFVAGDSAGGNLAAYCVNQDIKDKRNVIKGQILLYPTINLGNIKDKYTEFDISKFNMKRNERRLLTNIITAFDSSMKSLATVLGTDDVMNIDLTPYKEVSSMTPNTFITAGEHDSLKLDSLAYAKKLIDAGVKTKVTIYKGMGHAYIDQMGNYPQAEDCANDIIEFINDCLAS